MSWHDEHQQDPTPDGLHLFHEWPDAEDESAVVVSSGEDLGVDLTRATHERWHISDEEESGELEE